MIVTYAAADTFSGACRPDVLRDEIRAAVFASNPANVVGVTADNHARAQGHEIEIEYAASPTGPESAAIADTLALHDHTLAVVQSSIDTVAVSSEVPPGCECVADSSSVPLTLTLPAASTVLGRDIVVHRRGANLVSVEAHGGDGGMLVDGLASLPLADGEHARFGITDQGDWIKV